MDVPVTMDLDSLQRGPKICDHKTIGHFEINHSSAMLEYMCWLRCVFNYYLLRGHSQSSYLYFRTIYISKSLSSSMI